MPHVLIVEDDSRSRRTLHLALAAHGYQVSDAADGKRALDVFAADAPDLIVLDWHLPEFDGIQTCRSLRATSAVPILMVSGNRLNTKAIALAAGATDYLAKPFSVDELLRLIKASLKPSDNEQLIRTKGDPMSIQLSEENGGKILAVHVSGKLVKADYEHFVPEFERLLQQHGKLRVLFDMAGFHGWDAGALWEDIKFDIHHFADIERLAMVGDKKWQHGMATFCKPFTKATIRYFDHTDAAEARKWLGES